MLKTSDDFILNFSILEFSRQWLLNLKLQLVRQRLTNWENNFVRQCLPFCHGVIMND